MSADVAPNVKALINTGHAVQSRWLRGLVCLVPTGLWFWLCVTDSSEVYKTTHLSALLHLF